MKKILFFINTLAGGGAEKVLVDLLNSLNPHDFDITLVTVIGGIHEHRLASHIKYRKLISEKYGILSSIAKKIIYLLPKFIVYKLVSNQKFDIEVAYLEGFPTKVIACKKHNTSKVAFVHCDLSKDNLVERLYPSSHACFQEYASFQRVCFVSQDAQIGFFNSVGTLANSSVIHNIINFEEIKEMSLLPSKNGFQTSKTKLIAVGRLSKEKGFERLVRIVGELEKTFDFELCLLGEGDQKATIEKIIKDNNITSVKLLGFCSNPYAIMKDADITICSSFYEGYSTVAVESIFLGVPVLTTDCAGMSEILHNGKFGIITENSDCGLKFGLADALSNLTQVQKFKQNICEYNTYRSSLSPAIDYENLFKELNP